MLVLLLVGVVFQLCVYHFLLGRVNVSFHFETILNFILSFGQRSHSLDLFIILSSLFLLLHASYWKVLAR